MTEPSAKIIADSISPAGDRLTTMEVVMHRSVLAEFNTHRALSRNSESSRAVPVEKKLDRFRDDPAWPAFWAAERPGMIVVEELGGQDLADARNVLADIHEFTVWRTQKYLDEHPEKGARLHKGLLNRPMEWALYQTVVCSSTEWDNFWNQRCSPLAQPEMRVAAEAMKKAYDASTPGVCPIGAWHLPYVDEGTWDIEVAKKVSVARCARVSVLQQDGQRDIEKDLALYDRLISADPPHASPLEHVATPCATHYGEHFACHRGNFKGWDQVRHLEFGF